MPRKTAGKIVPTWAKPKAPKQVKELFKAKKEVTEKDAKKLKPLTKWLVSVKKSDNLGVFIQGFLTAALPLIFLIVVLLSV